MRPNFLPFLLVVLAAVVGCDAAAPTKLVRVTESNGNPIEGVKVEAAAVVKSHGSATTDAQGDAVLPKDLTGAQWIAVTKDGYLEARMPVPQAWPLRVTLQKTGP